MSWSSPPLFISSEPYPTTKKSATGTDFSPTFERVTRIPGDARIRVARELLEQLARRGLVQCQVEARVQVVAGGEALEDGARRLGVEREAPLREVMVVRGVPRDDLGGRVRV